MSLSTAAAGLYRALDRLRLYKLDGGTLVDSELHSYDAAFSRVERLLGEVEKQAFVQTADGEGLIAHERMVGLGERPGISPEIRRALVLYRLSVAPFDFTAEGMKRSLKAAGVDAELIENYPEESVTVRSNQFLDEFDGLDSLKARISEMLPAHLDWEFDTGLLTWDMFDGKGIDWNRWDAIDFTWDMFDIDGHNLLQ